MPDVPLPLPGQRQRSPGQRSPGIEVPVYHATCPMCRFTADLAPNNPQGQSYPTYDGDRILVAKFPYEFANPKRWDVIVFKYPGNSTMNYIKRLVGLPGETHPKFRRRFVDPQAGRTGGPFRDRPQAAGKSAGDAPARLRQRSGAHDRGHLALARALDYRGGPETIVDQQGPFLVRDRRRRKGEAWIRYRHRVPTPEQWQSVADAAGKKTR